MIADYDTLRHGTPKPSNSAMPCDLAFLDRSSLQVGCFIGIESIDGTVPEDRMFVLMHQPMPSLRIHATATLTVQAIEPNTQGSRCAFSRHPSPLRIMPSGPSNGRLFTGGDAKFTPNNFSNERMNYHVLTTYVRSTIWLTETS